MDKKYFFADCACANFCHERTQCIPGRHFSGVGCGCNCPHLQSTVAAFGTVSRQVVQISQSWRQLRSCLVGNLLLDPRRSPGQLTLGSFCSWMCLRLLHLICGYTGSNICECRTAKKHLLLFASWSVAGHWCVLSGQHGSHLFVFVLFFVLFFCFVLFFFLLLQHTHVPTYLTPNCMHLIPVWITYRFCRLQREPTIPARNRPKVQPTENFQELEEVSVDPTN